MDPIIWVVLFICALGVGIAVLGNDLMAYLWRNDRIKKSTGNARDNVRIENHRTGIRCAPVELEPISENEMKVIIKSLDPPFSPYTLTLRREDLKHDPFETLATGMIHYWLPIESNKFPDVITQINQESSSQHPVYTVDELNTMNRELTEKLQLAQAQVRNEKANIRSTIEESIENSALLSKSSKPTEIRKS